MLGKLALSFSVPVDGSISLSTDSSWPVASFWVNPPRSYASTPRVWPALSFARTGWMLSSGMVKTTVIGWICAMTSNPVVEVAWT